MQQNPVRNSQYFEELLSHISLYIYQINLIQPKTNILCSISGGQDSIVLLIILLYLKNILNIKTELIYFNHLWQKPNLYYLVQIFKLSYLINVPISIIIAEQKLGSEQIGHIWRRKNLFRIGFFKRLNSITTGHTKSDQIETAIWHLIRGTSPAGFLSLKDKNVFNGNLIAFENKNFPTYFQISQKISSGKSSKKFYKKFSHFNNNLLRNYNKNKTQENIFYFHKLHNIVKLRIAYYSYNKKPFQQFDVIRPLSNFHRDDISTIRKEHNLPVLIDSTNKSLELHRNKIRLVLLPLIRYFFKSTFDLQIGKYLRITTIEQDYLNKLFIRILESFCNQPEYIKSLFNLPITLQNKCFQYLLEIYTKRQITLSQIFNITYKK